MAYCCVNPVRVFYYDADCIQYVVADDEGIPNVFMVFCSTLSLSFHFLIFIFVYLCLNRLLPFLLGKGFSGVYE